MLSAIDKQILLQFEEASALMLWDLGAIKINVEQPYKLVSGNFSPIYINCRQVISDSTFMHLFTACARFISKCYQISLDVVAGGETAGIPFAAFLAQSMALPMVYVRKAKKGHGIDSLVEGNLLAGAKVLLVEDLITDAESKLHFIDALRASGGVVESVLVLFDREQGGREALKNRGIHLHAVSRMTTAMRVAEDAGLLSKCQLSSVRDYLNSPYEWHIKYGLNFVR